jgi:hypothetical protein
VLSQSAVASHGRTSDTSVLGPTLLVGVVVDAPYISGSRVSLEAVYGPYRGDRSLSCFASVCSKSTLTAGAVQLDVMVSKERGRGTWRPWVGVGAGMAHTWFVDEGPDAYYPPGWTPTAHLAVGLVGRRWRIDSRGVFIHEHPHTAGFGLESRHELQLRLTAFVF